MSAEGREVTGKCGSCDGDMYHDGTWWRHIADDSTMHGKCPTVANPRINLDDDGTLDDFFAKGVESVHFEAIDQAAWYATIHLADGRIWLLNFGAKNSRAHGYAHQERVQ